MENRLDRIEVVTDFKHLQIREIKEDGTYHRRVLHCGDDVSAESEKIQEQTASLWTDEVKEKWNEKQAKDLDESPTRTDPEE
jgi:hypothetical protein